MYATYDMIKLNYFIGLAVQSFIVCFFFLAEYWIHQCQPLKLQNAPSHVVGILIFNNLKHKYVERNSWGEWRMNIKEMPIKMLWLYSPWLRAGVKFIFLSFYSVLMGHSTISAFCIILRMPFLKFFRCYQLWLK